MSYPEIKYSVNSTLGSANFKSLDLIIRDVVKDEVTKRIIISPSDKVYTVTERLNADREITFYCNGTISVKIVNASDSYAFTGSIYKNGVLLKSGNVVAGGTISQNDITIATNDIIKFGATGTYKGYGYGAVYARTENNFPLTGE